MGRPLSSNIIYPFIPGTPSDDKIKGIKDIVLCVYGTPEVSTVSVPSAQNKAFASLTARDTVFSLTFSAYIPLGGDEFTVRNIYFDITETEGFGSVSSTDGYSTLFVAFSELTAPVSSETATPLEYVLEPGTIRWLQSAAVTVTMVNEQRLSKPTDRSNLTNTAIKTFDSANPIKLKNGYNVDLGQNGNDIQILGSAEAGMGKAPDNMWEDISPPVAVNTLQSINGKAPETDGDFFIETTDHVYLSIDGSEITITDTSLG